jgi:hypothetical protein
LEYLNFFYSSSPIGRNAQRTVNVLFAILVLSFFALQANSAEKSKNTDKSAKFWLKNPQLKELLFENRKILISARKLDQGWSFKGVGGLKTDLNTSWKRALEFSELKKASRFLHEVKYDEALKNLSLVISILGKEFPLKLKLDFDPQSQSAERVVHMKVIEGYFKGAQGDVIFLDSQGQGTQVECLAFYEKEVSFNETIFQVTIEAVMKYVAEIMRTHIEQR